jgi:hypothetical protein
VQRPFKHLVNRVVVETIEDIDPYSRQQRIVEGKARIFRRRADEGQHPAFDMRQKRVLLGLVEAMNFIHEQHGAALLFAPERLRPLHRRPEFAHPGHHGREPDQLSLAGTGQQFRQGGFTRAGWSPQHHRMGLSTLDRGAQRFTRSQQMALADKLVQSAWA